VLIRQVRFGVHSPSFDRKIIRDFRWCPERPRPELARIGLNLSASYPLLYALGSRSKGQARSPASFATYSIEGIAMNKPVLPPTDLSRRGLLIGAGGVGLASCGHTLEQPSNALAARPLDISGPVIDAHMHLQAPEWFKRSVFERAPPRKRRRSSPPPPGPRIRGAPELEDAAQAAITATYGPTLVEQTRRILFEMDKAGIDTAILMAMDYDYTGERLRVQHWEQLVALAEVRDRYPTRFVLFAAIDPRRGRAGIEMLRRAKAELDIVGMGEFAPHFFGFAPNDREYCYPIYEACAELDLMIAPNCSIVTSHVSRWCDPIYFEDVANDFPQTNICLTSFGAPHWTETAFALANSKHNIFLDTADWQAPTSVDQIGTILNLVHRCLKTDARHKIMFGSDHPVYNRTVSEKRWLEVFTQDARTRGLELSREELELFFSQNAQEFLDLDLPLLPR
jgi:predicted TIM-barrel fold metal-dependent hydrolase